MAKNCEENDCTGHHIVTIMMMNIMKVNNIAVTIMTGGKRLENHMVCNIVAGDHSCDK